MTDVKQENQGKTLTIGGGRLQLGKSIDIESRLKSSPSGSKSRTVTVEVKKTRSLSKDGAPTIMQSNESIYDDDNLTSKEREARLSALKAASIKAEQDRLAEEKAAATRAQAAQEAKKEEEQSKIVDQEKVTEEVLEKSPTPIKESSTSTQIKLPHANQYQVVSRERKQKAMQNLQFKSDIDEKERIKKEEERKKQEDETKKQPQESAKEVKLGEREFYEIPSLREKDKKTKAEEEAKAAKPKKGSEDKKFSGRILMARLDNNNEEIERTRSLSSLRRARAKTKKNYQSETAEKITREVTLPEFITVQELANRMAERSTDVIKLLMKMGMMVTINQTLDADTAELVITEMGHICKRVAESDVENLLNSEIDAIEDLTPRAPVVTIMGHVDHGKTSLLDALRMTDVVAREAGGITQHIGAYQIEMENGHHITFLDTPGHEAFTEMRSRGAKVTDVVVLVVAADDGIKEQTIEALNHAKAAEVPIIVAVNKMDKPGANPERVYNELLSHGIVTESMGGETIAVEVSAKQRLNLEKLEEAILLQSEILELKANPNREASGTVIEAKIDKGRGAVATLLIQRGTLKVGDIIVAGSSFGRVRALIDDKGRNIRQAIPSQPIEVLGLNNAPIAGDEFHVVESEKTARDVAEYREKKMRNIRASAIQRTSVEDFFMAGGHGGGVKEMAIIIKGDVHGSIEAIAASLLKIENSEVRVKILHQAVGGITESDVSLAKASKALIIGFNVRANPQTKAHAEKEGVEMRYYSVIYDLIDDVRDALSGMLKPHIKEEYLGNVSIRQVFNLSKFGKIAGCMVTNGIIKRGARVRLLRNNIVIHEGRLKTLKRFKDDVKEVSEGFECGVAFENYEDIREGDAVEAFELVEEKRSL